MDKIDYLYKQKNNLRQFKEPYIKEVTDVAIAYKSQHRLIVEVWKEHFFSSTSEEEKVGLLYSAFDILVHAKKYIEYTMPFIDVFHVVFTTWKSEKIKGVVYKLERHKVIDLCTLSNLLSVLYRTELPPTQSPPSTPPPPPPPVSSRVRRNNKGGTRRRDTAQQRRDRK